MDEITDKACRVLMCRWTHLELWNIMDWMMGGRSVNPDKCEFGNDAEHVPFYDLLRKEWEHIDTKADINVDIKQYDEL